jgi:hypothetical protein
MNASPQTTLRSEACAEDLQALGYRFAGLDEVDHCTPAEPGWRHRAAGRAAGRPAVAWGWTLATAMLAGLTLALALPAHLAGV